MCTSKSRRKATKHQNFFCLSWASKMSTCLNRHTDTKCKPTRNFWAILLMESTIVFHPFYPKTEILWKVLSNEVWTIQHWRQLSQIPILFWFFWSWSLPIKAIFSFFRSALLTSSAQSGILAILWHRFQSYFLFELRWIWLISLNIFGRFWKVRSKYPKNWQNDTKILGRLCQYLEHLLHCVLRFQDSLAAVIVPQKWGPFDVDMSSDV